MFSQGIKIKYNSIIWILDLEEDEATLSHKDIQVGVHTQLSNESIEGQLQEIVVVVRKEELAHNVKQREVKGKHSGATLTKWEE